MFSRPDSSGWKPAPSSIMALTRLAAETVPLVGRGMPASSLSIVDLPEPLEPMRPYVEPVGTSKEMSRSAENSRASFADPRTKRSLRLVRRSLCSSKTFETRSALSAGVTVTTPTLAPAAAGTPARSSRGTARSLRSQELRDVARAALEVGEAQQED